jgi:hypothetical protein
MLPVDGPQPRWSACPGNCSHVQDRQRQVWSHCSQLDTEVCHGMMAHENTPEAWVSSPSGKRREILWERISFLDSMLARNFVVILWILFEDIRGLENCNLMFVKWMLCFLFYNSYDWLTNNWCFVGTIPTDTSCNFCFCISRIWLQIFLLFWVQNKE